MNITEQILQKKPLGRKAYGSIPHLPTSRLGPGDHHCHEGQARICLDKVRDKHDRIIVTEKLDGSNVCVANADGKIVALGRAGYLAQTSKYEQHQFFAHWVRENEDRFAALLDDGQAIHGEWLAQAHGTIYDLYHEPFVAFDMTLDGNRLPWDSARTLIEACGFKTPRVLSDGLPFSLDKTVAAIETSGHGVRKGELVEGAVWRVERRGDFDFLAKWVRPGKIDGKYLPEVSGQPAIWHWRP